MEYELEEHTAMDQSRQSLLNRMKLDSIETSGGSTLGQIHLLPCRYKC